MPFLFICSTGDHAGQSIVAWSIARRLLEKGANISIFKPFGTRLICVNDAWSDPDAFLFKDVLDIQYPLEMICPYVDSEKTAEQNGAIKILEEIKSLAHKLSTGKDLLIILGSKHIFFDSAPHSLPETSLISELNADLVLVHRYRKISTSLYSVHSVN